MCTHKKICMNGRTNDTCNVCAREMKHLAMVVRKLLETYYRHRLGPCCAKQGGYKASMFVKLCIIIMQY